MNMRKGLGMAAFLLVALFGLSAVVMWLWNYAVVPAFNTNPLNYWQAMALLVLSKILLSSFRPGSGGKWKRHKGGWRRRWRGMSDEERSRFKDLWKQRCEQRKNSPGN